MNRFDRPKAKFVKYTPPPAPPSTHPYEVIYTNAHGALVTERCYSLESADKALRGARMKFDANARLVKVR